MKTLERLRQDGLLASEINKLESRIWRRVKRDGLGTLQVTSAVRGEGKSTTVAYLATSLGLYPGRRVVVIDFDFRIPTLNNHLGLDIPVGIDRVLDGKATLAEAIVKTELPGLHVAAPANGGADPELLLRTHVLRQMFDTLRDTFDLVLMDTPAILPVADPTILMPFADGVILAAMAGKTTETQLARAREICEGLDANILGLVVGNMKEAAPDYVSGDYDYGYSGYGNSPEDKVEEEKPGPRGKARRPHGNGPRRRKPAVRK